MDLFGSFVIACSMYSRIPMPQVDWTENRMKYAMCFFPLIGVIMGAALWLTALIGENVHTLEEGSLLWAVMGTILPLLITGGIHLDGYLDVTDARSSYGDRAKKLEILKDPHVGAFAVIGCGIYLLAYAGFFSLIPGKALPLISGIYVLTRALSALALVNFPKAKKDGLAAAFSDGAKKRVVTLTMSIYLVLTAAFLWWYGGSVVLGVMAAGAVLSFLHYDQMSKKEFGGITGDLAGYFLQQTELLLVAILAVWYHLV